MKQGNKLIIFFASSALVVGMMAYFIIRGENFSNSGPEHIYKFRMTKPSQYDVSRYGNMYLRFDNERAEPKDPSKQFKEREEVYVTVIRGKDGFAQLDYIYATEPNESNYFAAKIGYDWQNRNKDDGGPKKYSINMPFDKYHYSKKDSAAIAKAAEFIAYDDVVYAEVIIKDGLWEVKQVYINDRKIEDYAKHAVKTMPKYDQGIREMEGIPEVEVP